MRTIHVILTTHWDREWVQTVEQYRFRLVGLIDRTIALLAAEPALCFVLDGQTIVLEDYLAVRPERRGELEALGRAGRLVSGPWYVLADQFLEGDEATVRNLLLGRALAADFGGAMAEGYNPDSFGSIASMPMILRGFGIGCANLGRGVRAHGDSHLFRWAAPDGSEVIALDLGYGNGLELAYPDIWSDLDRQQPDPDHALTWAKRFLATEAARFPGGLYASAGVDHMEPRPGMTAVFERLTADTGLRWEASTPARFLADRPEDDAMLPLLVGEQRGEPGWPMDLQGTLSTDGWLKRRNREAELLLTRILEPLAALRRATTGSDERHVLHRAWRLVVAGHAHDSICACSTDAVMAEVHARLRAAGELAVIASERWLRDLGRGQQIMVFNGLPGRGVEALDLLVRVPGRLSGVMSGKLSAWQDGRPVATAEIVAECQMDLETHYAVDADLLRLSCKRPAVQRPDDQVWTLLRLRGSVDFAARAGTVALDLRPGTTPAQVTADARTLDNGLVRWELGTDGQQTLSDLVHGRSWSGIGTFEDQADAGDTYDFRAVDGDAPHCSQNEAVVTSRLVEHGAFHATVEVTTTWSIPTRLNGTTRSTDAVPLILINRYTIHARVPRIDVVTAFDNRADHHRLRIAFRSTSRPALTTGGHFTALPRPWSESTDLYPCRPVLDWIHRDDGLALLVPGLYDLEPRMDDGSGGTLLLTILRSVDTIGPAAGCNYPVEHARALGQQESRYALAPAPTAAAAAQAAQTHAAPLLASAGTGERTLIQAHHPSLICSALKRAEDDRGLVVRWWNATGTAVSLPLDLPGACRARLDETPVGPLDGGVLVIGPHAVATVIIPDG